jgi:tRNA (guanine-N7-)-methyltransferase
LSAVRVRQHVNPLSQKYQQPADPPNWAEIYANPARSLYLDIGCGRGKFLIEMAQQQPEWNFLGLEIREPVVIQANRERDALGLTNLHFMFCNANNALKLLLATYCPDRLQQASIQFPDPWFKKRHQKRRVVQPQLVNDLATYLVSSGRVLLQSDVQEVAIEMCDRFQEHPGFVRTSAEWLDTNPLPVPTEREQLTLEQGDPVYRAVFVRQ